MDAWPPFDFLSPQGEHKGVSADYLKMLNQRLGGRLNVVPGDWQQIYNGVKEQKLDALMDITPTAEREAHFHFTQPYLSVPHVIVANKDAPFLANEQALTGLTIALEKGFGNVNYFQKNHPGIAIKQYRDTYYALDAVARGEADAYVGNRSVALYIMRQEIMSTLKVHGRLQKKGSVLAIGVRKDMPELAKIFDKALASISKAEIIEIHNRWVEAEDVTRPLTLTESEKRWLAQHQEIRLASDIAWPPFETISSQGLYSGIAADYFQIIGERLGVKFIQSPRKPWDRVLDMFKDKELDVLTCAMETTARQAFADFTEPYIANPMVIVTKDDVGFIDGLPGLKGKTIAIEDGYASYDLLSQNHPELLLKTYKDSLSAMMAVSKGEVFSYISNIATLSYMVREQGITNIKISGQLPYQFELAIGIRDDWPELVPIMQKALNSIDPETRNEILQKWIAVKVEEPVDLGLIMQIATIALLVLLTALYFNLRLSKKVQLRTTQLQYQAHFDSLTNLPNRVLAFDRLSQVIADSERHERSAAVLILDIDDFKKINDTLGHEAGDIIIIEAATRLNDVVRTGDTVSRLGGDEFIILLNDLAHADDVLPIIQKIITGFGEPFKIKDRELVLTVSIGVAIYPENGRSPAELFRCADIAMYNSKKLGRNTYSYFTKDMHTKMERQVQIEEYMHGAIERGEFSTYFQPKIHIETGDVCGFEALVRWHNPQLGSISPMEFIPIAENNGLIVTIGRFVLTESLKALSEWQVAFDRALTMAVNLSPRQFREESLVAEIENLLNKYNINPMDLELEITEGLLISSHIDAEKALRKLKRLGINIAMDDFGTGYSSLSYLRTYPFDTLKIDREFIKDFGEDQSDRELVFAAIAMAHALGLTVVAEGVETAEQLQILKTQSCDIAQGFYFSKPMPLEAISDYLVSQQAEYQ